MAKKAKVIPINKNKATVAKEPESLWPMYLALALVVAVPLVFSRWTYDQFDIAKLVVARLLTLAMLVSWLFSPQGARVRLRRGPMDILLLGFLGAVLVSSVLSVSFTTALIGKYKRYEGLLTFYNYALLYFLGAQIFRSSKQVSQLSKALVGTAYIVAAYGLLQFLGLDPIDWGEKLPFEASKAFSTFGNPDLLAGYLVLVIPMALAEFLAAAQTKAKVVRFLGFLVIAGALVVTFTRGAWIGAFIGLVLLLILARRQLADNLVGLGALAGVFVAALGAIIMVGSRAGAGLDLLERVSSMTRITEGSAGSRLEIWKSGLAMIKDRPLFGFGPDTFRVMSERYETLKYVKMTGGTTVADNAHNYIIQIGAGAGLVALAVLLGFLIYWLAKALPAAEEDARAKDTGYQLTRAGLYAGVLAYMVHLLFGISLIGSSAPFWLLLGAMMGSSRSATLMTPAPSAKPANLRVVLAVALIIPTLFVAGYGVLNFAGDHYFTVSILQFSAGEVGNSLATLDTAAAFYPGNSRYYGEIARDILSVYGSRDVGAIDQAISLLRRARIVEPMEVDNLVFLGAAYNSKWRLSRRAADFNQSNKFFHMALLQRRYSVAGQYLLGVNYFQAGRYREARTELKKAEQLAPQFQQLPTLLADIDRQLRKK